MGSGAVVCGGGRVALVLQFVLCWGSDLPTPTPSKQALPSALIHQYQLSSDW